MRFYRNPRILILHASVGSGHTRAAQAVELALRERCPAAHVRSLDVLTFANAVFRTMYGGGYLGLASSAPHLLGYLYEMSDRPDAALTVSDSIRRFVQSVSLGAFRKFLKEGDWDMIVCAHFLPAEMVAQLRRRGDIHVPQAVIVTDFDAHRFWVNKPCEHFFVATKDGASSLRYWGVREEGISVTGIPIHPNFMRTADRENCLKIHGLHGDRPILLQLAGGCGMGPIEDIYRGLLRMEIPIEIVVVAGSNADARERLSRISVPTKHRAHILGYTDKMHDLMATADIVISKPGGLTTSEALACGVPMAVINPIPGQESRNCDYLLENGAAIKINGIGVIRDKLASILRNPERMAEMRARAGNLGRPDAAFIVAEKILEMIYERQRIAAGAHQFFVFQPSHSTLMMEAPVRTRMDTKMRIHGNIPFAPRVAETTNDTQIPR